MDSNYFVAQPIESCGPPRPRLLLKEVYSVYAGQFWRWFAITAPTSILASITLLMADRKIREIYSSFPIRQISSHMLEVAEAGALRYCSYFFSWFLGCFALAAIATVANGLNRVEEDRVWISDSFQRAREHFGGLVLTAIVTFSMFLAGAAGIELISFAVIRIVGWARFSRFSHGATFIGFAIGYVIVASIVSWFGMAIPLILAEDIGVWAALKKSAKISNGYEIFLSLLVAESMVGSYVAWYAVHYGLTFLFPIQLRYTAWHGWLKYFVAILASAGVQPPMFIGFSLLAGAEQANPSPLPVTQCAPHVD
jgi:hypothetical protein